jgi:putative membrane protein
MFSVGRIWVIILVGQYLSFGGRQNYWPNEAYRCHCSFRDLSDGVFRLVAACREDLPMPYCGAPPSPGTLWQHWNLDPVLLLGLVASISLYHVGVRRRARLGTPTSAIRRALFDAGWAVTALALISPLCPLSVALFSARVAQHVVLGLVGAPLVMAGQPVAVVAAVFGRKVRAGSSSPLLAAFAFAAVLWFWHTPVAYAATFSSTFAYWAMHFSAYGAAMWLWAGLLDSTPARMPAAIGAGLISTVQMGLLGALITLSPRAFYSVHASTTAAWHMTQLQDQQLGGAIMWIPGCVVFLAVAMLELAVLLGRLSRPSSLQLARP